MGVKLESERVREGEMERKGRERVREMEVERHGEKEQAMERRKRANELERKSTDGDKRRGSEKDGAKKRERVREVGRKEDWKFNIVSADFSLMGKKSNTIHVTSGRCFAKRVAPHNINLLSRSAAQNIRNE